MKSMIFVLIFTLSSSLALAGSSVQSPDALESDLKACLMKNKKASNCMETILGKSILPGNDQLVPIAKQLDELLQKWLSEESIYASHSLRIRKSGDIYEKRTYMIEDTSGSLMVFNVTTLKRLGKWYVFQFNLSSTSSEVNTALKGE